MKRLENFSKFLQAKKVLLIILIAASFGLALLFQKTSGVPKDSSIILAKFQVVKTVFPNLTKTESENVENLIRQQIRLIVGKPVFPQSLKIAQKYQNKIRGEAAAKKFPQDLALGVALLENGGTETAVSYAGAAGIFQLTEGTAKTLGLKIDKNVDERLDPEKNIQAGISYLDQNLELFSDAGLAVWAHHAGTQNVAKALKVYLQSIGEEEAYDFVEAVNSGVLDRAKYVWRAYVTRDNLNVHKLLQTPALGPFLADLSDETELYPYKVVAASILFEASSNFSEDEFLKRVQLFNQGRILLADLLTPS